MRKNIFENQSLLKRVLRRRLPWILVGIMVLLVLFLGLLPYGIGYGVKRAILSNGGQQVELEDVDFNPFTGRLSLRNLEVYVEEKSTLTVPRVMLQIGWSPFFKKRAYVKEVEISGGDITIEELPQGRWRIGGVVAALLADRRPPSSPWGMGLNRLEVTNGRIQFLTPKINASLNIEHAQLTRVITWLPTQIARLDFSGQLNGGDVRLQAEFSPFDIEPKVNAKINAKNVPLASFAGFTDSFSKIDGQLFMDVTLKASQGAEKGFNLTQNGNVTLEHLHLQSNVFAINEKQLSWSGTIQARGSEAKDQQQQLTAHGRLEGTQLNISMPPQSLHVQHSGLSWKGKLEVRQQPAHTRIYADRKLALDDIFIETPELTVAEKQLVWEGNVQLLLPPKMQDMQISSTGKLAGGELFAVFIQKNLKINKGGLSWEGNFNYRQSASVSEFVIEGQTSLPKINFQSPKTYISEDILKWNGIVRLVIPVTADRLQLDAKGHLEGGKLSMNVPQQNLSFAYSNLNVESDFKYTKMPSSMDFTLHSAIRSENLNYKTPNANISEKILVWKGDTHLSLQEGAGDFELRANGQLDSDKLSVTVPKQKTNFDYSDLAWAGTVNLTKTPQTTDTQINSKMTLRDVQLKTENTHLSEASLVWKGGVQLKGLEKTQNLSVTAQGTLNGGKMNATLQRENLKLAHAGFSWNGGLKYGLKNVNTTLSSQGNFSINNLNLKHSKQNLSLLELQQLTLNGIKMDGTQQISVSNAEIKKLNLVKSSDTKRTSDQRPPLFSATKTVFEKVAFAPHKAFSVDSVTLENATAYLHHTKEGTWTYFNDLGTFRTDMRPPDPQPRDRPEQPAASTRTNKTEPRKFGIRIGRLQIVGESAIRFDDERITPAFRTSLNLSQAVLSDLNSDQPEQPSPVKLAAKVGKYSHVELQGNLIPFAEGFGLDLKGNIGALELPPLSPYAVKKIGYDFVSGELDAEIDLKIFQGKLQGENKFLFKNLKVKAVETKPEDKQEAGLRIPLESSLKILRDKKNNIRLEVPVSGDITDPKFSFTDAVNQAVIKALQTSSVSYLKYMLGPYGTAIAVAQLAAKAMPKIRLKPVMFEPGGDSFDDEDVAYLQIVAKMLRERPALRVSACGLATESDRTYLSEKVVKEGGSASSIDENLQELAKKRAELIEEHLVSQYGIEDNRIFICKPEFDKNAEAAPRVELLL